MRSRSLVLLGAMQLAGCLIPIEPTHVVARLDSSNRATCNPGDTLQLLAKNGDQVVDEVSAPCSPAGVSLDLSSSAAVTARLLAARGGPGIADDVVVDETTDERQGEPGMYYINVYHGFVALQTSLAKQGHAITCVEAGVATLRLAIEEFQQPGKKVSTTMFACDQPEMFSAPLRDARSYTMTVDALDARGAVIGSGLGAFDIPGANRYADEAISINVQ